MLATLVSWDVQALAAFRGWIDPSAPWFPALKTAVHLLAAAQVLAFAVALAALWLHARFVARDDVPKRAALSVFWVTALAFAAYAALNLGLPVRPRPETVSAIPPLIAHLPDNSFPSGHAIFWAASTYGLFAFCRRWLGWASLALGAAMCASRVLAGVHYPGDILAGALLGLLLGSAFVPLVRFPGFVRYLVDPLVRAAKFVRL